MTNIYLFLTNKHRWVFLISFQCPEFVTCYLSLSSFQFDINFVYFLLSSFLVCHQFCLFPSFQFFSLTLVLSISFCLVFSLTLVLSISFHLRFLTTYQYLLISYANLMFVCFFVCLMVFNATFNNISVISLRTVVLVEEAGGPRENDRPAASH